MLQMDLKKKKKSMYILSQKGLLGLLSLLSEEFLTLYLPMCLPFFLASMGKGVPLQY